MELSRLRSALFSAAEPSLETVLSLQVRVASGIQNPAVLYHLVRSFAWPFCDLLCQVHSTCDKDNRRVVHPPALSGSASQTGGGLLALPPRRGWRASV